MNKSILNVFLALAMIVSISSCREQTTEEKVEDAVEDVADDVEDAAEDITN